MRCDVWRLLRSDTITCIWFYIFSELLWISQNITMYRDIMGPFKPDDMHHPCTVMHIVLWKSCQHPALLTNNAMLQLKAFFVCAFWGFFEAAATDQNELSDTMTSTSLRGSVPARTFHTYSNNLSSCRFIRPRKKPKELITGSCATIPEAGRQKRSQQKRKATLTKRKNRFSATHTVRSGESWRTLVATGNHSLTLWRTIS